MIELDIIIEGQCDHGPKFWWETRSKCWHHIECCWGRVEYPRPDPRVGEVGHLCLASRDWFDYMITFNASCPYPSGTFTATVRDGRRFIHLEHDGQRWTWEMFDTRFRDGQGPDNLLIGRWPD